MCVQEENESKQEKTRLNKNKQPQNKRESLKKPSLFNYVGPIPQNLACTTTNVVIICLYTHLQKFLFAFDCPRKQTNLFAKECILF